MKIVKHAVKGTTSSKALARKEKNSVFCMNWEIKLSKGHQCTVSSSMGAVGKVLKKRQTCSFACFLEYVLLLLDDNANEESE